MINVTHNSRAVNTPYGYFLSMTDAAKFIYEADRRLRIKHSGQHPYNTIVNLRNMVSKRCESKSYREWSFA